MAYKGMGKCFDLIIVTPLDPREAKQKSNVSALMADREVRRSPATPPPSPASDTEIPFYRSSSAEEVGTISRFNDGVEN